MHLDSADDHARPVAIVHEHWPDAIYTIIILKHSFIQLMSSKNEFPVNPFLAVFIAFLFLAAVVYTIYDREHETVNTTLKAEHVAK